MRVDEDYHLAAGRSGRRQPGSDQTLTARVPDDSDLAAERGCVAIQRAAKVRPTAEVVDQDNLVQQTVRGPTDETVQGAQQHRPRLVEDRDDN